MVSVPDSFCNSVSPPHKSLFFTSQYTQQDLPFHSYGGSLGQHISPNCPPAFFPYIFSRWQIFTLMLDICENFYHKKRCCAFFSSIEARNIPKRRALINDHDTLKGPNAISDY